MLTEYFSSHGAHCKVVGCPKTIDNDLKNDTSPSLSALTRPRKRMPSSPGLSHSMRCLREKKYHFVRLMGRSASHIALEVALQCRPNLCWLGEEVAAKKMTLAQVAGQLVDLIRKRAALDKYYGVVLVPEGLIEFVPELGALISEINDVLAAAAASGSEAGDARPPTVEELGPTLKQPGNAELLRYLPADIAAQLLLERDSHGNVNVSSIETEKLIFECAMQELRASSSSSPTASTSVDTDRVVAQFHFFGFEGRSALPSVFDTNYCYALGFNAGVLLAAGKTGVISTVSNLKAPVHEWLCGGMPLTHMMNMERRAGKDKPVIKKALTELNGKPFQRSHNTDTGRQTTSPYSRTSPNTDAQAQARLLRRCGWKSSNARMRPEPRMRLPAMVRETGSGNAVMVVPAMVGTLLTPSQPWQLAHSEIVKPTSRTQRIPRPGTEMRFQALSLTRACSAPVLQWHR